MAPQVQCNSWRMRDVKKNPHKQEKKNARRANSIKLERTIQARLNMLNFQRDASRLLFNLHFEPSNNSVSYINIKEGGGLHIKKTATANKREGKCKKY